MKKNFEALYEQMAIQRLEVIVDKETGDHLCASEGSSDGLILDNDGKPVIKKDERVL